MAVGSLNLKDNIENEELKIESFIAATESNEYLSELPGIKDLVLKLKGLYENFASFIPKIMSMLDAIAKFLNLNGILDSLGISKLLDFIFGLVGDSFLGLGGTLVGREALRALFMDKCLNFNSNVTDITGFSFNSLLHFSLMAILIGMLCADIPNAHSSLHTVFVNNDEYVTTKNERDSYISERDNIYGLDSIDDAVRIPAETRYANLTVKITEKDDQYNSQMSDVDKLFAKTFTTSMLKDKGSKSTEVLKDMSTLDNSFSMARTTDGNIGNTALSYLDKDQQQHKDKVAVYDDVNTIMLKLSPKYKTLNGEENLARTRNHPFLEKISASKSVSEPIIVASGNDYTNRSIPDEIWNLI